MPDTSQLEVVTPERVVASEAVTEIQLPGLDGYLGILPGHAPLLTELGIGELSFHVDGQIVYATVMGGFAEVLPDRVIVLADVAERCEEIDVKRADASRDRAEKRLAAQELGTDWDRVLASLRRANTRIELAAKCGAVSSAHPEHRAA